MVWNTPYVVHVPMREEHRLHGDRALGAPARVKRHLESGHDDACLLYRGIGSRCLQTM